MPCKANLRISEQICETSGPVMYIGRIFGVFPVSLEKDDSKIFLKWSPVYAFYSFFIGTVLSFLTYGGVLVDIVADRENSIKIKSNTDMYVVFCDTVGKQSVLIFGIFVDGIGFLKFFKFIKCLNQVDAIMPLNHTKYVRKLSMCIIATVLIAVVSIATADILMYYKTAGTIHDKTAILKCYLASYGTYCVVLMIQYRFWHLADSILRRLKQLNENLQNSALVVKRNSESIEGNIWTIFEGRSKIREQVYLTDKSTAGNKKVGVVIPISTGARCDQACSTNRITQLTTVYVKLCNATDFLNDFAGVTNAITILDLLWHFVETPYHLLSEITGPRKHPAFIIMMITWCLFHFSRLLILVEPCNSCLEEAAKTKMLACKLLYSDMVDETSKSQLKIFFTVLTQYKLEFTAAGLTKISRLLITAMIGTVCTYLVVLMQFQTR